MGSSQPRLLVPLRCDGMSVLNVNEIPMCSDEVVNLTPLFSKLPQVFPKSPDYLITLFCLQLGATRFDLKACAYHLALLPEGIVVEPSPWLAL